MSKELLIKNTELNNIFKDYSIIASTNSYILTYNANLVKSNYGTSKYFGDDISKYLELNVVNRINNFQTSFNQRNEFNFTYSYSQSDYNIIPNSLIISNLSKDIKTTYSNSYIVFYNTNQGLKQLTYHYKEGNGLYYDKQNKVISLNIDNESIKEQYNKLYFDTNSIPITSQDNYGIAYVDNKYLTISNGILSINQDYIENVISYKYKIKNLYDQLNNIYNSLSYYNDIYDNQNNAIDEFVEYFDDIIEKTDSGEVSRTIKTEISYHHTGSLYFPNTELKYIDNYYFSNGLIDPKYKQFITLNESNSYIIYCKDIEKLEIFSYIENEYIDYGKIFNINKIRQIESKLDEDTSIIDISDFSSEVDYSKYVNNNNRQEIMSSNNIYTYIYFDETNNYNKFNVNTNIVNNLLFSHPKAKKLNKCNHSISTIFDHHDTIFRQRTNGELKYYEEVTKDYVNAHLNENYYYVNSKDNLICYPTTVNKIRYNNTEIDSKLFKKLGLILNTKTSLPNMKKIIIEYTKNDNSIKYDYTIQKINCKYYNRNIKVLYDDRDIKYCVNNDISIPYNSTYYYFFSNYKYDSNINNVPKSIAFMLKNIDISFDNNLEYLFYGYNYTMKDSRKFTKNYFGIWHDLPTYYMTNNFMRTLINNKEEITFVNFKDLYTENFNEVEFDNLNYKPVKLYLYKLYKLTNGTYRIRKVEPTVNSNNYITISI